MKKLLLVSFLGVLMFGFSVFTALAEEKYAPIYDSLGFACDIGANETWNKTSGAVLMNIDEKGNLISQVLLENARPDTTYDIWVNQDPVTCPLDEPTKKSLLTTNEQGEGTAKITIPAEKDAQNFWITLTGGGQTLRSTALELK